MAGRTVFLPRLTGSVIREDEGVPESRSRASATPSCRGSGPRCRIDIPQRLGVQERVGRSGKWVSDTHRWHEVVVCVWQIYCKKIDCMGYSGCT